MALALLALATVQQPVTLTLAADTTIERRAAEPNPGRGPLLTGGLEKAILVRFPDLGIKVGVGRRVKSAQLVLSVGRPGEPKLAAISRVLRPWSEAGDPARKDKEGNGEATWTHAMSGKGGLQWERDGASGSNDAQALTGVHTAYSTTNDAFTIDGLAPAVQEMIDRPEENYGFRLSFSNAAAFFSADSLANGPALVLTFDETEPRSAPDLQILVCEENAGPQWVVTVKNAGDQPTKGQTLTLTVPGRDPIETKVEETIEPGATATLAFALPSLVGPIAQQRRLNVRVEPNEPDKNPSDNGIALYPNGLAVALPGADPRDAQQTVTDLNERVFPFSKFGAWPSGCMERIHLVTTNATVTATNGPDLVKAIIKSVAGLPESLLRPYAADPPVVNGHRAAGFVAAAGQVGLLPDTRDDVLIPRDLAIPDRTTTSASFGDIPMNQWGMLSRSEVTVINSQIGKPRAMPWGMTPTTVFFRVFTPDGAPPGGAKLELYQLVGGAFGGQPVFTADLGLDGSALLPPRAGGSFGKSNPYGDLQKDGSNAWLLAVVRLGDTAHSTWIPVWQLWDEFARGNQSIAFVELRVQLASSPLDTSQNLALDRLVTDSKGRFPAELSVLTDGKNETSLSLADEPAGYWIDIDLGRDRPIGQIQLVFDGPVWKQFRVLTYKTAQSPDDALVWSEESNGPANTGATKTEDGKTVLSYSARTVRSRFVRIVPLSREAVKLSEIRVIPIKS